MKAWLEEVICGSYNGESHWRIAAYWLVIITFFSAPLVAFGIHLVSLHRGQPEIEAGTFPYLTSFHHVLAVLLAAMLGFNSFDKWKTNGKSAHPPEALPAAGG